MNETDSGKPIQDPDLWVDLYGDYLHRFAIARIKDPSVAEDLVQETFLAALRGLENFKNHSAARTWLTAILKHKIVDFLRKQNREHAVEDIEIASDSDDGFFKNDGHWKIKPGKWDINPDKIYEQREFLVILDRCLTDLPERLARAFVLREMEGYSTAELCKALGITATNSWVMLYRARLHLRNCLELKWFSKEGSEES